MKKIIALILIFILACTSIVFADMSTLDENIKNDLTKYGIITNYEIQKVTRAEGAKIIMAMCGITEAERCDTVFTDVTKEYWASGYIDMAYNAGIINGKGDGTFAPEEKLTNEQFLKMLVVALGYEPNVTMPYPIGYMMQANILGLTEGVEKMVGDDMIIRSEAAVLVHNALDTPMMFQTGFGAVVTYEIQDGKFGRNYYTLRTAFEPVPEESVTPPEVSESDVPLFNGPEYTARLVQIKDLKESNGVISFKNNDDESDENTYIIDNSTYIWDYADGLPLEDIENGLYAVCWYYTDDAGDITLLKIRVRKDAPIMAN